MTVNIKAVACIQINFHMRIKAEGNQLVLAA